MSEDRYGLIGHPVSHSRSPFIHGLFAQAERQAMTYRVFDVLPEDLDAWTTVFFAEGGRGLNVTVPHKPAAVRLAAKLTPRAQRAAAVNTLSAQPDGTLLGDNTDGVGLVRDLTQNFELDIAGRRILLLGAGGATRGVVAPLLELGPAEITIANRTPDRAVQLAAAFDDLGPVMGCGFDDVGARPYDLVVNATAATLAGERPQISPSIIGPKTFCYDMAYGREASPFLRWAAAEGCARAELGWGMLVEQAAEAFHVWRGVRPSTALVLAAVKNA